MYQSGHRLPIPPMVSVYAKGIGWMDEALSGGVPSSTAPESANLAVYHSIVLPSLCVVRRVWWANGTTTTGGATIEAGVYADAASIPGTKLVSGSAVQGTATAIQFVDVTDTVLPPGRYWLALVASSATNTTLSRATARSAYRLQQASAYPLPATATPVTSTTGNIYLVGFATTASP